jgi:ribosome-binding factor A
MKKRSHHEPPAGPTQRQLRVGEELRHALAEIFTRGGFRDPVLFDLNVTVSEVRTSPDMRNATAFVMPLGGTKVGEIVEALNRAAPYIRGQLAKKVDMRHMPRVDFRADESFAEAERIGRLLHRPDVAADLARPRDDDEP